MVHFSLTEKIDWKIESSCAFLPLNKSDRYYIQVDVVCHGQTPIMPDVDGADPYAVCTIFYISNSTVVVVPTCYYHFWGGFHLYVGAKKEKQIQAVGQWMWTDNTDDHRENHFS